MHRSASQALQGTAWPNEALYIPSRVHHNLSQMPISLILELFSSTPQSQKMTECLAAAIAAVELESDSDVN